MFLMLVCQEVPRWTWWVKQGERQRGQGGRLSRVPATVPAAGAATPYFKIQQVPKLCEVLLSQRALVKIGVL